MYSRGSLLWIISDLLLCLYLFKEYAHVNKQSPYKRFSVYTVQFKSFVQELLEYRVQSIYCRKILSIQRNFFA